MKRGSPTGEAIRDISDVVAALSPVQRERLAEILRRALSANAGERRRLLAELEQALALPS